MPATAVVARAALHPWEEPVLCGPRGAGTVFFSGCNLGCSYCQNAPISRDNFGRPVSASRLREIFEELIARGAATIDLVTPTHFVPFILPALDPPLPVPVVHNCGGYESVETLKLLDGKVQVYLPDLKYADADLARELSCAPDYFSVATAAIREMFRQTGPCVMENGLLRRGVLIRHLVLPGHPENTRLCLDWIARTFRPGEVLVSLMSQYTPQPGARGSMARPVTAAEYRGRSATWKTAASRTASPRSAPPPGRNTHRPSTSPGSDRFVLFGTFGIIKTGFFAKNKAFFA
ncbi:MAG: 4Fe-4S cluster-binding domain-containing protein [Oscillospiraceae bacterium]